jgi:predicted amidophosphoribosyltransferase
MAMTTCRECQQAVSTSAERCPHCGVKFPTPEVAESYADSLVWAVSLVGVGALVLAMVMCH